VSEVPLFPLRTVLFPGGSLRLRIFEPRYLNLVSRCLREEIGFGVVLIRQGAEVGPAVTYDVGTLARITDWYTLSDGLLGITALGEERLRIRSSRREADGLVIGDVTMLGPERATGLEPRHTAAIAALQSLSELANEPIPEGEWRPEDAAWVAARLAELLPSSAAEKQSWLELADPIERLDAIMPALAALRPKRPQS
jgi:Lon protease-like protein